MDITFECDKCGQSLVVEEAGAGMTTDCPECGKPVYVPSASRPRVPSPPEPRAPVKARVTNLSSPHAERVAQLTKEMEDNAELTKYIAKPNTRVIITDAHLPFWSVFVLVFKAWISSLILFILFYPIFCVLSMKLA